jgi:type I restriction enzyme M protein
MAADGTGGMLTVAEETLQQIAKEHGTEVATHLHSQEDQRRDVRDLQGLLLNGEGDAEDNIVGGPKHSNLANNAFPSHEFDFMLSNPLYVKSWKSDLERTGGKSDMKNPRFMIVQATTRPM